MTICGLVLAGGHGRRLGGADKALLPLAGRPLLGWLLPRLAPQVDALAISANGDPARFAAFGLPVLPDPVVDQGPLSGLLAGLDWAAGQGAQALLTVPADTPFIPLDEKSTRRPKPFPDPLFPMALHLLKIRAAVSPDLLPHYTSWSAALVSSHELGSPHAPAPRRKRRRRR